MPEGFFRKYAPKGWLPVSAGTRLTLEINLLAVQANTRTNSDAAKNCRDNLQSYAIRMLVDQNLTGMLY